MASGDEDLTYIEELCGLAGVVPGSCHLNEWIGSVLWEKMAFGPHWCYTIHPLLKDIPKYLSGIVMKSKTTDLLFQIGSAIFEALDKLCDAIGLAQRKGICYDSFTMLGVDENNISGGVIRMYRITVAAILGLRSRFKAYLEGVTKIGRQLESLSSLAKEILHRVEEVTQGLFSPGPTSSFEIGREEFQFKMVANTSGPESKSKKTATQTRIEEETVLNSCALVVQLLILAFLSYIQAHVGALNLSSSILECKSSSCWDVVLRICNHHVL